jgi:uncharacterized membrane protein YjfL (UPF0719 family)
VSLGPIALVGFTFGAPLLLLLLLHAGEHLAGGRALGATLRTSAPAQAAWRLRGTGQLLGVSIVATSAVRASAEGEGLLADVTWVAVFAIVGLVLLVASAELGIRLLLGHTIASEIERGNPAAGIAAAAHYVAASLVVSRALGGHSLTDLGISLAFLLFAQLALHAFVSLFRALTTYDDAEQIHGENRAVALSYGGALVAMALLVGQAVEGDFTGWTSSLQGFGAALAAVLLLYPVRQIVVQVLLLQYPFAFRGGKLDRAVGIERSDSMATLEAFAYLATALAVVRLRA